MKHELLELICCPACQQGLTVIETDRREPEIWTGTLHCAACGQSYPIAEGMPRLYVNDDAWTPKAVEAEGWVTYHKELGIYDVQENAVDLQIPYYPEEPWIQAARAFDTAVAELQLTGQETILDLGAGRGWAAKQFALRGCRVVALDVVPDANVGLGRARALMDHAGTYFDRIIADGENLPFVDGRFDLVFCAAALHHSSHLNALMQQVGRVLKPGGRLCAVNEPCRGVLENEAEMLIRDAAAELEVGINETRPDLPAYQAALAQAGLTLTHAYSPITRTMDDPSLRNWAATMGAIRPSLRQRPLRAQLAGWRAYTRRQRQARRLPTPVQVADFAPPTPRQEWQTAVLLWVGGELFLLGEKPA
jgi:SAM-dependent methyltransferase